MGLFKKDYKKIGQAQPVPVAQPVQQAQPVQYVQAQPVPLAQPIAMPQIGQKETNPQNEALKQLRNHLVLVVDWIDSSIE